MRAAGCAARLAPTEPHPNGPSARGEAAPRHCSLERLRRQVGTKTGFPRDGAAGRKPEGATERGLMQVDAAPRQERPRGLVRSCREPSVSEFLERRSHSAQSAHAPPNPGAAAVHRSQPNGKASCPSGKRARGSGGGCAAIPCLASKTAARTSGRSRWGCSCGMCSAPTRHVFRADDDTYSLCSSRRRLTRPSGTGRGGDLTERVSTQGARWLPDRARRI